MKQNEKAMWKPANNKIQNNNLENQEDPIYK